MAEWQQPKAGMFIWLKLLAGVSDVDDIAAELVQANVMVLPGTSMQDRIRRKAMQSVCCQLS